MTPMIKKDYARYHASGLILSSGPVEARRQDLLQAPAVAPLEEIRAAFGYWKVRVERPLRLVEIDPARAYTAKEIKALKGKAERSESAPPVIKKIFKKGVESDPVRGLFAATVRGRPVVVQYEPDPKLRDTEQIPLLEEGGIEAFIRKEVLPYAPDAWYVPGSVKVGYEISFTREFYKPQPLRPLEEIRADILAVERETEGLLGEIIGE